MYSNTQNSVEVDCLPELLSTWTHDGLAPLTIVKGFSDLLNEGYIGILTQKQRTTIQAICLSVQEVINSWDEFISYFETTPSEQHPPPPQKLTTHQFDTLRTRIIDPAITTLQTIQAQTTLLLEEKDSTLTAQQLESLEAVQKACFFAIQRWHDPLDYFAA